MLSLVFSMVEKLPRGVRLANLAFQERLDRMTSMSS